MEKRDKQGVPIFPINEFASNLLKYRLSKDGRWRSAPPSKAGKLYAYIQVTYLATKAIAPSLATLAASTLRNRTTCKGAGPNRGKRTMCSRQGPKVIQSGIIDRVERRLSLFFHDSFRSAFGRPRRTDFNAIPNNCDIAPHTAMCFLYTASSAMCFLSTVSDTSI